MNKSRRMFQRNRSQGSDLSDLLRLSALSVGASMLGILIISFFVALIAFNTKDPLSAITPFAVISICFVSVASGFISNKLCKASVLTAGLLSGVMLTLLILIVAMFLRSDGNPILASGARVLMHIIPIPLSVLGSFLGSLKPKAKRRTTIHRR